jgi:hypothetical protein
VVVSSVGTAVDGLLRNRAFGVSLYLSDLIKTITAVAGVAFADPAITEALAGLDYAPMSTDSYGNLVIDTSQVVTKSSDSDAVTITVTTSI